MSFLSHLLWLSLIRYFSCLHKWFLSSHPTMLSLILTKEHMQFLISGRDKRNKGDYFASLIAKVTTSFDIFHISFLHFYFLSLNVLFWLAAPGWGLWLSTHITWYYLFTEKSWNAWQTIPTWRLQLHGTRVCCTLIPLLAGLTVNGSCGSQALIVVMILLAGAVDTTQAIFLHHIT